jgi:hypothetical protein
MVPYPLPITWPLFGVAFCAWTAEKKAVKETPTAFLAEKSRGDLSGLPTAFFLDFLRLVQ